MKTWLASTPALLFCAGLSAALADSGKVTVFGVQLPAAVGGGFQPAGTNLVCGEISKDGLCFDGKQWHRLFPAGLRHYAPRTGQITCNVIVDQDCWDGKHWYHLVPQN